MLLDPRIILHRLSSSPGVERIKPATQQDAGIPLRRIDNTHVESKGSCEKDENKQKGAHQKDEDNAKNVDSKTHVRRDEFDAVKDHNAFMNSMSTGTGRRREIFGVACNKAYSGHESGEGK